jgi:hypothetical protein
MRLRSSSAAGDWLLRSLAPALLVAAPLTIFLRYQRYPLATSEVLLLLLAVAVFGLVMGAAASLSTLFEVVAIAALLTWCADTQLLDPSAKQLVLLFVVLTGVVWILRAHVARIISLMAATVIATSFVPMRSAVAVASHVAGAPAVGSASNRLPLVVHLILDEHIGLEGIRDDVAPASFKDHTRTFFTDKGFKVFGGAYSEHPWTMESISHLLNLISARYESGLHAPGPARGTNRLTRNAYFERFRSEGFAVRVYHPDYLDECAGHVPAADCHGYAETSLRVLRSLSVSAAAKASVLAHALLEQSDVFSRIVYEYQRIRQRPFGRRLHLSAWNADQTVVAPIATMQAVDRMTADLARSRRGELFFAHLLLPHFPYVYDANCRPRPPSAWRQRGEKRGVDDEGVGRTNTPDGRAERYALYFEQMTCAQRTIDRLLAAIPADLRQDAILIVQGDHGARIGRNDPTTLNEQALSEADYVDFYSTLFAVRAPRLEAGYEPSPASTTCLLQSLVESGFSTTAGAAACSSQRVVFLKDRTRHLLPIADSWPPASPLHQGVGRARGSAGRR